MSSLQHLGGTRWLVRIADGTMPNGRPWQISRTIHAATQREAARIRESIVPELRRELTARKEQRRIESDPNALTVERLTLMWLAAKRTEDRAAATIAQYETNASRWLPVLGPKLATELTPVDIDNWLRDFRVKARKGDKYDRVPAASTKRQIVNDLGSCLKFGARKFPGHLPTPPVTAAVTLPTHRAKRHSMPDVDVLSEAVPAMLEQGLIGIAGALALGAGLRQGEACALQWTSIRQRRLYITDAAKRHGDLLAAPKRESVRDIPVSSVTQEALLAAAAWVEGTSQEGSPWVLPSVRSGPLRPASVSHGWPAVAKRVGLEGVTFHGLRHACGSLLLQEGHGVEVVSRALGHANPAITMQVYAHVLGKIGSDLFDRSDRALGLGASDSPAPTPPPE